MRQNLRKLFHIVDSRNPYHVEDVKMALFKRSDKPDQSLVHIANENAIRMLEMGHKMFRMVTETLIKDTCKEDLDKIKKIDKEMDQLHREVRRQIYEHLSLSGAKDLFFSLVLLSVVDDSERIGDHSKNIAEIIELLPQKCDFGKLHKSFLKIWKQTDEFFKATLKAFISEDESKAEKILKEYQEIAKTCDGIIASILSDKKTKSVKKDIVALILLVRFFKRINAHLKDIASTVINPYPRIGYRYKEERT
jgi:phosphate transport system protein